MTHASTITTTPVFENGGERAIAYRAAEHAILYYSFADPLQRLRALPQP